MGNEGSVPLRSLERDCPIEGRGAGVLPGANSPTLGVLQTEHASATRGVPSKRDKVCCWHARDLNAGGLWLGP